MTGSQGVAVRPRHAPTLRHLRAIRAVARQLNFRAAADTLALSQPALSAAINELEELFGQPLFDRSPHHVVLTAAGATLLPQAEWLINNFRHGVEDMYRSLDSLSLSLRIGILPSVLHIAAPELAIWRREFPSVRIVVQDLVNRDLVVALLSGDVDLGIGADLDLPESLEKVRVGRDELTALVPRTHPYSSEKALSWSALRGQPLALFTGASSYDLALATLNQQGVGLEITYRMLYRESILALVQNGFAIGIISHLYAHDVALRGLVAVRMRSPAITRHMVLMRRTGPSAVQVAASSCFNYLLKRLGNHPGFA